MKAYTVAFTPEARDQLAAIYRYIAEAAGSSEVAMRFTENIVVHCEGLASFPLRGVKRDDIRAGLRLTNYRKRVEIAYAVNDTVVSIIGVFYGGQNYETALGSDSEG
ncbi:MAG: type II toxin-antitoxin system RelE/ParE family toxin [Pseudomonadota bacterium]|nr:type II toxin-antitoxin system RelE/ParE family toxin [Pseudomonadota bacterium]